jgi:uncharacterized protein YndB with AHSA1/START domain
MEAQATTNRELSLSRVIDAPSDQVFQAWTDPELLHEWFASRPWITSMVLTFEEEDGKTRYTARVSHRESTEITADSLHGVAAVFGL